MALLSECVLLIDALAGTKTLRINGQLYSYAIVGNAVDFCRLTGRKPRELWTVCNGWCNCPAFAFHGGCKHAEVVKTGVLNGEAKR